MPAKKVGGSIASNSVTDLVTTKSYDIMNKTFTNTVSDGQCGGVTRHKRIKGGACRVCKGGSTPCKKCESTCKGGSMPSPAFDYTLPRVTKGGNIKSMHELMSQNSGHVFSLKHQSGGSEIPKDIGLNYNSSIKSASIPNGDSQKFHINSSIVNKLLSSESVGAMPALNKVAVHGSVINNNKFNYGANGAGIKTTLKNGFKKLGDKVKALASDATPTPKPKSSSSSKSLSKNTIKKKNSA